MAFSQHRPAAVPAQSARHNHRAARQPGIRLAADQGADEPPHWGPHDRPNGDGAWAWSRRLSGRPAEPGTVNGAVSGRPTARTAGDAGSAQRDERVAEQRYREIADGLAIAPSVTVVLPVRNEAANLPAVFASLPDWIDELVLVDGRSTDNTIEVARQLRPDVKIVLQGGAGKGDALLAGFAASTGDIIVTIDGDGSTDGQEIIRFVGALLAGADFAKGSRFNSAGGSDDITAIRRCGNSLLNMAVNRMFGTGYSDLCYGFNAFWARHLHELALDCPGFEVETLMSIRAARSGLNIHEVPSHERPRIHGASNLSAIKDGSRILRLILSEKRSARRRRGPKPFLAPGHLALGHHADLSGAGPDRSPAGRPALPRQTGPVSDGWGQNGWDPGRRDPDSHGPKS